MADRSYKLTLSLSDGSTINAGTITAPQGPNGANGVTFTPSVSAAGVLSWTNNGGLTNPSPVNIKGPKGDDAVITASDVEGWGFTKNKGTVTSVAVKINGTIKGTVTSSGTIDLGTVLTAHQDISGKANLSGGNTFTGKQTLNSPGSDGYSINAAGYVKGSWLQASSIANKGANTGKVCVFDNSGWIYYRTPAEIFSEADRELINENLNSITEVGWYHAKSNNTCTNRPSDISSTIPFVLIVEKVDSYIKQTLYRINTSDQTYYLSYVRYSSNTGSSWHTWIKQQTMSDSRVQSFSGRKTFIGGINISGSSLQFSGDSGLNGQVAMSQGSSTSPKWVNLQVKVNGTTYTADSSGLIDIGTISGGGTTAYATQFNEIY